jgi:hypothetical protein
MFVWATFGVLLGCGLAVLVRRYAGGKAMVDFIQRMTSREFLTFGFIAGYTILITVGSYGVPVYVQNVLMPAILLFGGFMAVTGRTIGGSK